jgi:steroid delta-isomerase-like uncharacterized protein
MKHFTSILMACAAIVILTSCNKKTAETPAAPDNRPAMKARFTALNDCFNSGNADAIDTLLASDVVDHSEDTTMHLPPGPAGLKEMIKMMREFSPDLKSEIKMMTADDDVLMVYGTMTGTNTGPWMGMPATGKKYAYDFVDIVKFDNSMKMKEHWGVYDQMKMMKDLGLMGGPPQDAKDTKGKKK